MKEAIISWFNERGIKPPLSNEDIINATYRSLADSYRIALHELEKITKKEYKYLYIVGGGAKNQYLNELAEKFTNKKVIALPLEATSCGNIIAQIKGEQENEK
jgi:rhamnulokinase